MADVSRWYAIHLRDGAVVSVVMVRDTHTGPPPLRRSQRVSGFSPSSPGRAAGPSARTPHGQGQQVGRTDAPDAPGGPGCPGVDAPGKHGPSSRGSNSHTRRWVARSRARTHAARTIWAFYRGFHRRRSRVARGRAAVASPMDLDTDIDHCVELTMGGSDSNTVPAVAPVALTTVGPVPPATHATDDSLMELEPAPSVPGRPAARPSVPDRAVPSARSVHFSCEARPDDDSCAFDGPTPESTASEAPLSGLALGAELMKPHVASGPSLMGGLGQRLHTLLSSSVCLPRWLASGLEFYSDVQLDSRFDMTFRCIFVIIATAWPAHAAGEFMVPGGRFRHDVSRLFRSRTRECFSIHDAYAPEAYSLRILYDDVIGTYCVYIPA